jgi:hypothetical protein
MYVTLQTKHVLFGSLIFHARFLEDLEFIEEMPKKKVRRTNLSNNRK